MKKILNKLFTLLIVGSLLGAVAAGLVSKTSAAVPPSLNNHSQDDPTITVKNKTKNITVYDTNITADSTDKVRFRVWVHNTSKLEENAPAHNVKVQVVLSQSSDKKTLSAKAYVSADDAHPASGEAKVTSNSEFNYAYVSNSTYMQGKDENGNSFTNKQMGDGIVGSGINIGTIKGCWDFVHQLTFDVQLSQTQQPTQNPNFTVDKKVVYNSTEYDTVDPNLHKYTEGENVQYKVTVKNTGNVQLNNVQFADQLPTWINWSSGDGSYDSGANKVTSGLGNMVVNDTKTLNYTAKVKSGIPTGDTTQTNTVTVTTDNAGSKQDSATVTIHKDAPATTTTQTQTQTQSQTVNITTAAAPAPQVLAATTVKEVPKTGAAEVVTLGLLSLLPLGVKLRKFNSRKRNPERSRRDEAVSIVRTKCALLPKGQMQGSEAESFRFLQSESENHGLCPWESI